MYKLEGMLELYCVSLGKIIYVTCSLKVVCPPHKGFFGVEPFHPSRNFSLTSYFSIKCLAFEISHILGISKLGCSQQI